MAIANEDEVKGEENHASIGINAILLLPVDLKFKRIKLMLVVLGCCGILILFLDVFGSIVLWAIRDV